MTTPAPRIYPPGGMQLTLRLLQEGQEAACVLGAGGGGPALLSQSIADAWRDIAWNSFRPLISSSVTCVGAVLRDVSQAEGLVVESGPPSTIAGGVATTQTLAAASTLIRWTTTTGGRSGKGRTFLPGLTSGVIGPGGRTYTSAHQTAVNTAINAYLSAGLWTANEPFPAVLSFTKGYASEITSGALASVVGLQRRRMR